MRTQDAALYTSSTVALDATTGTLAWHCQHVPGEAFDLDAVFERVLWETRLATSVQGYPITVAVNGRQYAAVATGLGGGSPRSIPNAVSPEIDVPARGHALYVFALRDNRWPQGPGT